MLLDSPKKIEFTACRQLSDFRMFRVVLKCSARPSSAIYARSCVCVCVFIVKITISLRNNKV